MRRRLLLLIALLASLGLVAGCGTSGGEASSTTTTAAPAPDDGADDATTTEPTDADEPDQPDDGGTATISVEELEALLPTEEEVGNGYVLEESTADGTAETDDDEDTDSTDQQFEEACPGLAELDFLDDASDADDSSAMVSFATEDERELEVELDPTSEDFTEDNLDELIDAFADCQDLEITDEDGFTSTISISAQPDGSRGDFGLRLDMDISIDFLGTPVSFQFAGQAFKIDDIAVFVSATSGLEETETDFTPIPLDEELLGDISDLMENRVNDR